MRALVSLWWLSFLTAVGLCVGSFLNAVIYRLPRGRSLRNPLWSFCPNCKRRIRWYDNLPVLSFVWLRGRCRHCHVPIATRYVVIELSMAMIVLMLVDAFFVSGVRSGIKEATFGLTDQLAADWPILLAHIILFACLLPMAVIDLEHYWVDVRFTSLATAAGFVLHTLWTPKHSMAWPRPGDTLAVMSVFALVGLALLWLAVICWPRVEGVSDEHGESEAGVGEGVEPTVRHPPPPLVSPTRAAGWILGLVTVGLFVLMWIEASGIRDLKHTGRALIPLLVFLVLIVREGLETRDADEQIAEAIHEERGESRRMVLAELGWLLPAVAGGAIGWWLMTRLPSVSGSLSRALHTSVSVPGIDLLRHWTPQWGFATAATGFIIGGGVGWAIRIVFTLLFGKEALGTGDIHLMAAAGCVAGWPVVVLGFFLACMLALVGWLAALPLKRSRAVPLGPWLSLAFLAVVVFYDPIVQSPAVARIPALVGLLISGR